jgi:hypothetical protein
MRRLCSAALVVSVLALVVGAGPARAQEPIAWNAARLSWPVPTSFVGGGSLADPLPPITYTVETLDPGRTDWRVVTRTTSTSYLHTGLTPGLHQWRVSAAWSDGGEPGPPTAPVSKMIIRPPPIVVAMTVL